LKLHRIRKLTDIIKYEQLLNEAKKNGFNDKEKKKYYSDLFVEWDKEAKIKEDDEAQDDEALLNFWFDQKKGELDKYKILGIHPASLILFLVSVLSLILVFVFAPVDYPQIDSSNLRHPSDINLLNIYYISYGISLTSLVLFIIKKTFPVLAKMLNLPVLDINILTDFVAEQSGIEPSETDDRRGQKEMFKWCLFRNIQFFKAILLFSLAGYVSLHTMLANPKLLWDSVWLDVPHVQSISSIPSRMFGWLDIQPPTYKQILNARATKHNQTVAANKPLIDENKGSVAVNLKNDKSGMEQPASSNLNSNENNINNLDQEKNHKLHDKDNDQHALWVSVILTILMAMLFQLFITWLAKREFAKATDSFMLKDISEDVLKALRRPYVSTSGSSNEEDDSTTQDCAGKNVESSLCLVSREVVNNLEKDRMNALAKKVGKRTEDLKYFGASKEEDQNIISMLKQEKPTKVQYVELANSVPRNQEIKMFNNILNIHDNLIIEIILVSVTGRSSMTNKPSDWNNKLAKLGSRVRVENTVYG